MEFISIVLLSLRLNSVLRFVQKKVNGILLLLQFHIVQPAACNRVVIDFGSEASQVGYRNGGPQSTIVQYDILENIMSKPQIRQQ